MVRNPYERFGLTELILRDELAIDRTILANERTFLAYLRSAVALFIAGVSIIHFSSERWFMVLGFVCLPAAVGAAAVGLIRFRKMDKAISVVRSRLKDERADRSAAREATDSNDGWKQPAKPTDEERNP